MQRMIPNFEAIELLPKKSNYCVFVFVINEGERLHRQLEKMKTISADIDIVIADGGSIDNSVSPNVLTPYSVNSVLIKRDVGKLGSQMRMAFGWALNRGYKGVVVVDGNNKDSVEDIPRFISKLEAGYDHIQGSRFIEGGSHENTPISRLLGLKLLHAPLISMASGINQTDTTNGFRAYSSKLLADPEISLFREIFEGYELHYYLAVRAARIGLKCIEVPVRRVYPSKGKTPTKISPIRGNLQVISKLFKVCLGSYNP